MNGSWASNVSLPRNAPEQKCETQTVSPVCVHITWSKPEKGPEILICRKHLRFLYADYLGACLISDLADDEGADDPVGETLRRNTLGQRSRSLERDFYVLWTGCQWKALPKTCRRRARVHDYPEVWNRDGTLERIYWTFTLKCASRKDGKPARRQRSSTRRPQKGGLARQAMTRLDPSG
jgi:transposase